jgi:8-oxo-dGTP pyrophosphatase MutT (NUDIX family)
MVYREKPEGFNSRFEIVSCFVEHDGEFLLLLRQDHKPQGNTWGVPAGKVEDGETKEEAIQREVEEETGYRMQSEPELFGTVYVRYSDYDFVYHMYRYPTLQKPDIFIDPKSHKEYRWISPIESLSMPLIEDEDRCVELVYSLK